MGSKNKFYGVESADHGFDDVGIAQPSGSISAATSATPYGPRFAGKTKITIGSTTLLRNRMPVRIASTDDGLSGKTSILKVLGATQVIINKAYQTPTTGTGTWLVDGGEGSWDAMMPIGGNITGSNLTMTFWDTNKQGSDENAVDYESGKIYVFPAGIKTILITSTGNVRLFRSATLRPNGAAAQ
jgi:hypothetical protein